MWLEDGEIRMCHGESLTRQECDVYEIGLRAIGARALEWDRRGGSRYFGANYIANIARRANLAEMILDALI